MKFINQYRLYQSNYESPDFEPPSFLREYETQVGYFGWVF